MTQLLILKHLRGHFYVALMADINISKADDMIKHVDEFPEKTFSTIFLHLRSSKTRNIMSL